MIYKFILIYFLGIGLTDIILDKYLIMKNRNTGEFIDKTQVAKSVLFILKLKYCLFWFITMPILFYNSIKYTEEDD